MLELFLCAGGIFHVIFVFIIRVDWFYYISTVGFLKNFKEIRKYYAKQWYVLPLLPLFNLAVFFIRFAGVVNSINTNSAWKTKNFTQEKDSLCKTITDDFAVVMRFIRKIRQLSINQRSTYRKARG